MSEPFKDFNKVTAKPKVAHPAQRTIDSLDELVSERLKNASYAALAGLNGEAKYEIKIAGILIETRELIERITHVDYDPEDE